MPHFVPTLEMLNSLKAACEAIELVPGERMFQAVKVFHTPDVVRALRELHAFQKRGCFLIPGGDEFENEKVGQSLRSAATREFVMLICDQNVASMTAAAVGDEKTAGIVRMKDLVVESLLGSQLSASTQLVRLRPTESEPIEITIEDAKKQPGRQVWQMTWLADAGWTAVTVNR